MLKHHFSSSLARMGNCPIHVNYDTPFCCYWHHWGSVCDIFDLGEVDRYKDLPLVCVRDATARRATNDSSWRDLRLGSCAHDKVRVTFSEDADASNEQIRPKVVPFWVVVANWLKRVASVLIGVLLGDHNDC